jgi:hypothetical protein
VAAWRGIASAPNDQIEATESMIGPLVPVGSGAALGAMIRWMLGTQLNALFPWFGGGGDAIDARLQRVHWKWWGYPCADGSLRGASPVSCTGHSTPSLTSALNWR